MSKDNRIARRQFAMLDCSIGVTDPSRLDLDEDFAGLQRFKLDGTRLKGRGWFFDEQCGG